MTEVEDEQSNLPGVPTSSDKKATGYRLWPFQYPALQNQEETAGASNFVDKASSLLMASSKCAGSTFAIS
ncbi:hypothetical protein ACLBSJ_33700, partial [Klebsiella pneumoniae]|uniref:hypothetical protein n=1 Tax=Klebsiella pneumoniae TaxID=573 RepID=UPI0039681C48